MRIRFENIQYYVQYNLRSWNKILSYITLQVKLNIAWPMLTLDG